MARARSTRLPGRKAADRKAAAERERLDAARAAGTAPRALYEDAGLIDALVGLIATGCSYKNAGMAQGLNASTVQTWVDDASKPGAEPALVAVVTRLTRARGEAATACEQGVHAGDGSRALWLERMDREQWGRHDKVTVDGSEAPMGRGELAELLRRNGGGES